MRTRTRRLLAPLTVTAVAALALAGCAGGTAPEGSDGSGGGQEKLVLGMTADLSAGWDTNNQPPYQSWGLQAVYETLAFCLPGGEIKPQAADEITVSDDRTSFTAHLREGNTFSDGSPVDAASVQASYEDLMETASDRFGGITFSSSDPQTITVTWPDPQPLINLRICQPMLAAADFFDSADRKTTPVGSGPYTYDASASTTGSVYELTKKDDYWNADAYPYEKLELRVLADETASINALKTGQIDGTVFSPGSYDEVEKSGKDIVELPGAGLTMIHLTDRQGAIIPALGDVRVRQAMNMVIDKQQIVDQLYDGHASVIDQPLQEGSEGYLADLKDPYPYDVDKAKALMKEAGFEDGFSITVPTMEGQAWTVMLPYLKQQLGELNITIEEKALSGPDAITNLLSGDYPVPVWNVGGISSIEDISVHILSSGFWNVSHQDDPKIDELWQKIVSGTEEESIAAQQEMNQYVVDQAWFVPILAPTNFYAYDGDKVTIADPTTDPFKLHPNLIDFQ